MQYPMEVVESISIIYLLLDMGVTLATSGARLDYRTNEPTKQASKELTQDVYFRSEQVHVPRSLQPFPRLTASLGSVTGTLDYRWGLRLRSRVSRHQNYRLMHFFNRLLRRTPEHKVKEQSGETIHFNGEEFHNLNSGPGARQE
jgi:hypothetical protein